MFYESLVPDWYGTKDEEPTRTEPCLQQYVFEQSGVAPQVFASWKCGDRGFMLMERLARSLSDFNSDILFRTLRQVFVDSDSFEKVSFKDVEKELMEAVFGAIEALLDIGCRHYDLHKENIMFDRTGRLRFLDFGLAECGDPASFAKLSNEEKKEAVQKTLEGMAVADDGWTEAQKRLKYGVFKAKGTWKRPLSVFRASTPTGTVFDWLQQGLEKGY
uniref:Protein kinase domain-containing protein n=1 Tax=Chromera velia CCMP2878 TaxID=1169474 RepID=A0A0G4HL45_9ALVE|eukprot:Cvel_7381.t1-p1 / transcript=Cvel_7381.t1 / gene=Cvel_7381 / organism=Chromera_velia_CCMP2878 / gene_product=hypothetical protein / transcript_product=hypothetical protein / location=Cvel_scaffold384:49787-51236(+) / protein_length=216 / sequence_SO=supercontig / SO=protein_coding / is_pseudo=false